MSGHLRAVLMGQVVDTDGQPLTDISVGALPETTTVEIRTRRSGLSGARVSERLVYLESRVARCELQRVEESHTAAPAPLCKA